MPELLLELFSEEIPARMQRKAAEDLRKLVTDALVEAGLVYEGAKAFATPRRLALTVQGIPARSPDRREERKGPRVGAPQAAIDGFLKAAGLASIAEARVQPDKKGEIYVAVTERPGSPANDVIAAIVPKIVRSFPWPKSMRWGEASAKPGSLVWVRPLHSIVCTFGSENEEPEVVAFDIDGVKSGSITRGHRFMAPGELTVRRLDDYQPKLEKAKVVLDADRRKDIILHGARDQTFALGLELVEDEALLEEVAGLVEWPVVLVGSFDPAFLEIPPEVIRATIRANQKCFVLRDPQTGKLAPRFILVANIEASDGGRAIIAGNERVIRARLSDARHFWQTDLAPLPDYRDQAEKPLDQRLAKLRAQNIVFHEKLGTQGERVERIARLAREIAPLVGADADKAERAALLAKADLVSEMVGEFPELQGLMGRYYATAQGEDPSVAAAIEDHYKPVGPNDRVPTDPVAIAIALADKLDTLVGFWAIDEKPTGSKDPYALRRAALGVIRIVLDNGIRLALRDPLGAAAREHRAQLYLLKAKGSQKALFRLPDDDTAPELLWPAEALGGVLPARNEAVDLIRKLPNDLDIFLGRVKEWEIDDLPIYEVQILWDMPAKAEIEGLNTSELLAFFADRLKVQLREQGARHDLVDAVFALGNQDDLLLIVRRVEALGKFLETDDGKNLLAGTKRAANILRDEEKKSGESFAGDVDASRLKEPEERALAAAVDAALSEAKAAVEREDFAAAMTALAGLRAPVDAFFEKVRVNDADPAIRANRLRLLNRIREATIAVADFSKIAG